MFVKENMKNQTFINTSNQVNVISKQVSKQKLEKVKKTNAEDQSHEIQLNINNTQLYCDECNLYLQENNCEGHKNSSFHSENVS